jgi:antitoxin CptB
MDEDLDLRRRRAAYRAWHRGTKEMDIMLGRFADSSLADMPAEMLGSFERLLALPDPELYELIIGPEARPVEAAVDALVGRLRAFHGLR